MYVRVLMAIVFGGMAAAQASTFAPDFLEAQAAASRMLNLLDTVPRIDSYSTEGIIPVSGAVTKLFKATKLSRRALKLTVCQLRLLLLDTFK